MAELSQKSFGNRDRLNQEADAEQMLARKFVAERLSAITSAKPVTCPTASAALKGQATRSPRKAVYRLAIVFTSRIDGVDCVVVNLSADGARISLDENIELPEVVTLRFKKSGVEKEARIAWRHNQDIGLSFIKGENDAVETEEHTVIHDIM